MKDSLGSGSVSEHAQTERQEDAVSGYSAADRRSRWMPKSAVCSLGYLALSGA